MIFMVDQTSCHRKDVYHCQWDKIFINNMSSQHPKTTQPNNNKHWQPDNAIIQMTKTQSTCRVMIELTDIRAKWVRWLQTHCTLSLLAIPTDVLQPLVDQSPWLSADNKVILNHQLKHEVYIYSFHYLPFNENLKKLQVSIDESLLPCTCVWII